jgi:predicted PurR-regulated permease PerM
MSVSRAAEERSRWIILMVATAIAAWLCWKLIQPFASVLVWSGILALLFHPLQRRLAARLGRKSVAAGLTVLIVFLTAIIPVGLVSAALVAEIGEFVATAPARFQALLEDPAYGGRIRELLERIDTRIGLRDRLTPEALQDHLGAVGQSLLKGTFNIVGGTLGALVNLVFVLFALFFLLRDGDRFVIALRDFLPVARGEADAMLAHTRDIIHASVYGVLVIAGIQGLLGGLAFAVLGIPSALLWGVVMTLLSILPMAGSSLVWAPAALILAAQGSWGRALALALVGVLVIGTIDNLLRPKLVGQRARMHELVIFFAVLGGLRAFGVVGLFLGPVVVAVSSALVGIFRRGGIAEAVAQVAPPAPPAPAAPPVAPPAH